MFLNVSALKRFIDYAKKTQVSFPRAVVFFIIISTLVSGIVLYKSSKIKSEIPPIVITPVQKHIAKPGEPERKRPKPKPFSMETIKKKGCVADGILSGYGGDTGTSTKMINESGCAYLHRALETWLAAPDFEKAEEIMARIKKPNMVYGMFIAEAISKKSKLYYDDEQRYFEFSKMCRPGTNNIWGEHTCRPSLEKKEYQKYVVYISKKAIDLGIQSFMFGQVFLQDNAAPDKTKMPQVLSEIRNYTREQGVKIIIGAQTNAIEDENYLRLFDYIEGGVGLRSDGSFEDGPCLTWRAGCWALLWNDRYSKKANNVLVHLDWSGILNDDMAVFARMDEAKRAETLRKLYNYFTSRNMGFILPLMATLHKANDGCYGPKKRFYSADEKYGCNDEVVINDILKK